MKKKIMLLLFILIISFFNINEIAARIDVNAAGGATSASKGCKTNICAGNIGLTEEVPDEPIDGIRVILMNGNQELGRADLWFTENKRAFAGGDKEIKTIFDKYYGYINPNGSKENEIFDYANMLIKIKENNDSVTIQTLLQHINSNYTIQNTKDYYLVIEPIFVLSYKYSTSNYYLSGTPSDIVNKLINDNSSDGCIAKFPSGNINPDGCKNGSQHKSYAKYFAYNDQDDCTDLSGVSKSSDCKNWNVIRNYFTAFQLKESYEPFTDKDGSYSSYWAGTYNTNIYGKGILKISDYITEIKCLEGNLSSNQVIDNSGNTVSCSMQFTLENKLTNPIKLQGEKYTSGQLIMSSSPITTGTLTVQCSDSIGDIFYNDYVGDVSLGGKTLHTTENLNKKLDCNRERCTTSVDYYFPSIYLEYISGKPFNSACANCKFVGYGLVTGFKESGTKKLSFKVNFNGEEYITEESNDCSYIPTTQLIEHSDGKYRLNIEFRTTSSKNPFAGKNGTGRDESKIGSNWRLSPIRTDVFERRNDSYNKLNSQPLYTIKLTSDDIISIRNYNKSKNYSYSDGEWVDGVYISKFLRDRSRYIIINDKLNIQWLKDF
ncbi:MAG: hypothetical protein E7163_05935 [Firmicutes bacterium]|nr:hypothetical protein [Bacillota bacterium]